jgi:hypothetical protein
MLSQNLSDLFLKVPTRPGKYFLVRNSMLAIIETEVMP